LCDAAATGQLSHATAAWLRSAERQIQAHGLNGLAGVELGENIAGDQRACHLEVGSAAAEDLVPLAEGLTGLSVQRADRQGVTVLAGEPMLEDTLRPIGSDDSVLVTLRRDVRSFFQGNRHLVQTLARHVTSLVPDGPVVDLYAGVGLFGLSLAALGRNVTAVDGDRVSGTDLRRNAEPFGDRVQVAPMSVETFVRSGQLADAARDATVVVDPPRTGLSEDALDGIMAAEPPRLVYVSCDPATRARDRRRLLDSGYALTNLTLFDMFPNTALVEAVGVFARG
jgi:23S rRNA (uracil1939-C5)-methyltransferase